MNLEALHLSLNGKRAIVCGSTQGIGKATAIRLANLGATIILIARDEDKLVGVCDELSKSTGAPHSFVVADFAEPQALREKVDAAVEQSGPVEILVNNTGGPPPGPIETASADAFENAMAMHLFCNQILVQAVIQGMKERSYGRIVNIISTSVREPIPGLGVSNVTRAAVAAWAKTLSGELGSDGITVNNVLPGFTQTARLASIISTKAQKMNCEEDQVRNEMIAKIPAGRIGQAEEIAAVVGFLVSPAASYVNGTSLAVDGGRTSSI